MRSVDLDLDDIQTCPRKPGPLSNRLSLDIQQSLSSSLLFLSPKAASIANNRSLISPFGQNLYSKFKTQIISQKLTSNKKIQLQLHDQNEAIECLRQQVQNRSIMSFKSMDSFDGTKIGKTLNQLDKIQKNYLNKNKQIQKRSIKYRIQKRCQKNKQNRIKIQKIQFTPEELGSLKALSPQLQQKIKSICESRNSFGNKLNQLTEQKQILQTNNKIHGEQIKKLNDKIRTVQKQLQESVSKNQQLQIKYDQLFQKTEQLVQKQRLRCLYEFDCQYSKEDQQLRKLAF